MTLQGAKALNGKLARFGKSLDEIAPVVAAQSVPDVATAVRSDIGDDSMSGWPRKRPLRMRGMVEKGSPAGEAAVVPYGRTGGALKALTVGRNADGGAGGFQGPAINRRTGLTSARSRATGRGGSRGGRRYNGRTQGKGTWFDAQKMMQMHLGRRSGAALYRLMNVFSRG